MHAYVRQYNNFGWDITGELSHEIINNNLLDSLKTK